MINFFETNQQAKSKMLLPVHIFIDPFQAFLPTILSFWPESCKYENWVFNNRQTFKFVRELTSKLIFSVDAMKRVEEIKGKRQAQYIFDRQKKARQIEKEKDIKEVKRDIALIRSPAVGMKRAAREMEVEDEEEQTVVEEMEASTSGMDTSLNLGALTRSKKKLKRAKVVQEVEPDQEMLAAEEN